MFSTIKAKLYAVGALLTIAVYALIKWLYASNESKKAKIEELKNQAKISKKISKMETDIAEYYGYQESIDIVNKGLEMDSATAKKMRGEINEDDNSDYTTHAV